MKPIRKPPASADTASGWRYQRALPLRPTAAGLFWLLAALALIATAVNYGNNLIFALAFLLLAIWLQAAWVGHRQLRGLVWQPRQPLPTFAGDVLLIEGELTGNRDADAEVALHCGTVRGQPAGFASGGEATPNLALPTRQRGAVTITELRLCSRWPLGLWQACRPLPVQRALVYPQPAGDLPLPGGNPRTAHRQAAGDNFQGLRSYAPGDSPRRINWRVFGRRDELAVNRFDGDSGGEALWLDWQGTTGDCECRLAQLTAWVLAADHAGREYGLRLPGRTLPAGRGRAQREHCLAELALYMPASPTEPTT